MKISCADSLGPTDTDRGGAAQLPGGPQRGGGLLHKEILRPHVPKQPHHTQVLPKHLKLFIAFTVKSSRVFTYLNS